MSRSSIRPRNLPKVIVFGWPSHVGGADTKLVHLLLLLHRHVDFTVVPNERRHLDLPYWPRFLRMLGIRCCLLEDLPKRINGYALSLSNQCFFTHRICERAKERGLKIVWSSEMMWHHEGELEAVQSGLIDKVLYTSRLQQALLAPKYGRIPGHITGNYVDPERFPYFERRRGGFTIGRLSRPAPEKYPEDFPVFYESLNLPECRFRVMAWDGNLAAKYRWHSFGDCWDLLPAEQEDTVTFLQSLDLFVYPLGHQFTESWGRSTVEAMLTGAIPLVPPGHHLDELIVHGETGFICHDFLEYQNFAQELCLDFPKRDSLARRCRQHAVNNLCDTEQHRLIWMEVFQ